MHFNIPLMIYDAFAKKASNIRAVDNLVERLQEFQERLEQDVENGKVTILDDRDQKDLIYLIDRTIDW